MWNPVGSRGDFAEQAHALVKEHAPSPTIPHIRPSHLCTGTEISDMGNYYCVDDCVEGSFDFRKSLTIHQKTCAAYLAWEQSLLALIEDRSPAPSPKRRRTHSISEVESAHLDVIHEYEQPAHLPASAPPVEPTNVPPRPEPQRLTRAQTRRLNTRFRQEHDALPETPTPLDPPLNSGTISETPQPTAPVPPTVRQPHHRIPFRTEPDIFGRYRVYSSKPLTIPDADAPMAHAVPIAQHPTQPRNLRPISDIISPCPNISVFYVLRYHWLNGSNKSLDDRDYLCNEVLLQPDFNPRDLVGVNLRAIDDALAEAAKSWNPNCPPARGWKNIPLQLRVPPPRVTKANAKSLSTRVDNYISIDGFRAQTLVDIMVKAFTINNDKTFNYDTFELRWKPPGSTGPAQTLMGEMYNSPAMIRANREVQSLKINVDCDLPRCVAGFMFSSDGMQFAQFSRVKGYPILCSFGNESKYERCKPSSNTCFQIAHIPSLPDKVQEQITLMHGGKPPSDALLTHLRRELMHAVWTALLDDAFVDAWHNGVVVKCADGITRRVFPRILTYSADYPEKVLLATIRNGGDCLCPRCLVHKSSAAQMGTPSDMRTRKKRRIDNERRRRIVNHARRFINEQGRAIQSKPVEDLLKEESYVPTVNVFSDRLHDTEFNISSSLVVDQLHEVELGVWKTLFKHLIRLVHLRGAWAVTEFNRRFRLVPTFGSTIRLFSEDVASAGRIAARDYEDILQCCPPVFEGLLPESCEEPAQTLLFLFAEWHGLAKLRLHTTATLKIFKSSTTQLGTALRKFAQLTATMDVRETPKEYSRRRKQAEASKASSMTRRAKATKPGKSGHPSKKTSAQPSDGDGRQRCVLNLNTYKMHSLGDYPPTIEDFGTTDSYSTQISELQLRKVKAQYMRTNKRDALEQMTRNHDIVEVMQEMSTALDEFRQETGQGLWDDQDDAIESLLAGSSYFIGLKDRSEDRIASIDRWVEKQQHEEAFRFFNLQLKRHLLARILCTPLRSDFSQLELAQIAFQHGQMYRHKSLRVNYTSYDVLRQQDTLNVSTQNSFVLLPAESEEDSGHPFLYAKILGVYHAKVSYRGRPPQRMDFVHVRWMYLDEARPGGWKNRRLDRVTYQPCVSDGHILDSFDFIDPSNILRTTHLIPDFQSGTTKSYLKPSKSIAHDNPTFGDWTGYYVNRFADRDMLMRYVGGGVASGKTKTSTEVYIDYRRPVAPTPLRRGGVSTVDHP
ncbi:hypothetical protein FRC12_002795 [Ceratobasidium sp. 428]|nr:hypothetical protein FRC12_002795 [Ceratobasidium sp. 428]